MQHLRKKKKLHIKSELKTFLNPLKIKISVKYLTINYQRKIFSRSLYFTSKVFINQRINIMWPKQLYVHNNQI